MEAAAAGGLTAANMGAADERGIVERATITEFESLAETIAAHDSPASREALNALRNVCERGVRIVEGTD